MSIYTEHSLSLIVASPIMKLAAHTAELSNCLWNFDEGTIATGSLDGTARLWDIRSADKCCIVAGHKDEVLDIAFNYTGKLLATASADKTCKIWSLSGDVSLASTLCGHTDEICRITFNPIGSRVLTASADNTARIWNTTSGACEQILDGHTDEVISCAFNYSGMAEAFVMKKNSKLLAANDKLKWSHAPSRERCANRIQR